MPTTEQMLHNLLLTSTIAVIALTILLVGLIAAPKLSKWFHRITKK